MNKIIIVIVVLFSQFINANDFGVVKGIVKSQSSEIIPGASIYIKNTKIGTSTNFNGEFVLK